MPLPSILLRARHLSLLSLSSSSSVNETETKKATTYLGTTFFLSTMKPFGEDLPDCSLLHSPTLIKPRSPTPNHPLSLSTLDDQGFLRFSIKYLYVFKKSPPCHVLRSSLSKALVGYYPLAGRLRAVSGDQKRLEVDCNGEGAVFAEAEMDATADEFLEVSRKPNKSWRKLLYKVDSSSFLDVPPLIVQVTNLRCGGMILCTAINHCICDGVGTAQFLHAWAHITANPDTDPPLSPFHSRLLLKPRSPPQITSNLPVFTKHAIPDSPHCQLDLSRHLQSQPLVPVSFTFTPSLILRLKRRCAPLLKCTAFEALASHTWRSWARTLDLAPSTNAKLLFSVNVRKKMAPNLPDGFYGNGFVLACAECSVDNLVNDENNLYDVVRLVQEAKSRTTDEHVRSVVDLLEVDRAAVPDLSVSLVISQWSRLGLEDVDFGGGRPVHMGPVSSDIYCLFLPVAGEAGSVRVLMSVPEGLAQKFELCMKSYLAKEEGQNGNFVHGFHGEENELICTV